MVSALLYLSTLLSLLLLTATQKETYIIHLKHHNTPPTAFFTSHLLSLSSDSDPLSSLLYTYSAAYNGFAASLTPAEADSFRSSDSVLGVYPDSVYSLHTTRTPEFLGISENSWTGLPAGERHVASDVIVGVLDTGVWPESRSYLDSGLPEVPSKWKGECESGPDFSPNACNRKLVGARRFSKGYRMSSGGDPNGEPDSPRDHDGHGTHTSSTAAGAHVANASLLGYASGTARGMAITARVATYKVCWKTGCFGSDILAGMEKAMDDGVDVLSMSLGGGSAPYYRDTIAIGAFAAVEKGIFVSCSAGNSGPARSTLANLAPWIMTVGAGTLDRDFPAYAVLGNNKKITGVSLYSGKGMGEKPVELVYNKGSNGSSNLCLAGSLDPSLVKGKVVLCDRGITARVEKGAVVRDAGAVGMILANTAASGEELVADAHLIPAVAVGRRVGDMLREYVRKEKRPTAVLSFGGTVLGVRPSPVVAAFSSRGPNAVTMEILKPDVIGPGVNILAGWSESVGPTGLDQDTRKTQFNIMSGTSMSCPHISGLAALLKAAHPEWSPSAIKSALMTTAYTLDNTNSPLRDAAEGDLSTPFAHGSGHVDPHRAISPGLVYDLTTNDYISFLCSLDYTNDHIQTIVKRSNFSCTRKLSNPGQLNYPSFSVVFGRKRVVRYTRELTNVGTAGSVYDVAVTGPASIGVKVVPPKLVFAKVGDKQRYTVTFVSKRGGNVTRTEKNQFGSLSWSNADHQVKSPIAYAWAMV